MHPKRIHAWKKALLDGAADLLAMGLVRPEADAERTVRDLYAQIGRQCALVGVSRSLFYDRLVALPAETLSLMPEIDE